MMDCSHLAEPAARGLEDLAGAATQRSCLRNAPRQEQAAVPLPSASGRVGVGGRSPGDLLGGEEGCPQRHSATAVSRPFLPQISPIFRHFSPVLSVLAPGSQTAQKNGGKTAQNGRETAEKEWAGWRWDTLTSSASVSGSCVSRLVLAHTSSSAGYAATPLSSRIWLFATSRMVSDGHELGRPSRVRSLFSER